MVNPEFGGYSPESESSDIRIDIEPGYEAFVPEEFRSDPFGYFESKGANIKPGEIKHDESGRVREDPTAVKDLPDWENEGSVISVVGKRVDAAKGKVGESGNPFYEYDIIKKVREAGLPGPKPVLRAKAGDKHLFIMEKVNGFRWTDRSKFGDLGLSKEDAGRLMQEAEEMMEQLKARFDQAGFMRNWKLKDMVFQIDPQTRALIGIVPVDFERTKLKANA
jgi:hypothetical protein